MSTHDYDGHHPHRPRRFAHGDAFYNTMLDYSPSPSSSEASSSPPPSEPRSEPPSEAPSEPPFEPSSEDSQESSTDSSPDSSPVPSPTASEVTLTLRTRRAAMPAPELSEDELLRPDEFTVDGIRFEYLRLVPERKVYSARTVDCAMPLYHDGYRVQPKLFNTFSMTSVPVDPTGWESDGTRGDAGGASFKEILTVYAEQIRRWIQGTRVRHAVFLDDGYCYLFRDWGTRKLWIRPRRIAGFKTITGEGWFEGVQAEPGLTIRKKGTEELFNTMCTHTPWQTKKYISVFKRPKDYFRALFKRKRVELIPPFEFNFEETKITKTWDSIGLFTNWPKSFRHDLSIFPTDRPIRYDDDLRFHRDACTVDTDDVLRILTPKSSPQGHGLEPSNATLAGVAISQLSTKHWPFGKKRIVKSIIYRPNVAEQVKGFSGPVVAVGDKVIGLQNFRVIHNMFDSDVDPTEEEEVPLFTENGIPIRRKRKPTRTNLWGCFMLPDDIVQNYEICVRDYNFTEKY